MSYSCHIAPDRNDLERNKHQEPEGERLRAELEEWLYRNDIVGILEYSQYSLVGAAFMCAATDAAESC